MIRRTKVGRSLVRAVVHVVHAGGEVPARREPRAELRGEAALRRVRFVGLGKTPRFGFGFESSSPLGARLRLLDGVPEDVGVLQAPHDAVLEPRRRAFGRAAPRGEQHRRRVEAVGQLAKLQPHVRAGRERHLALARLAAEEHEHPPPRRPRRARRAPPSPPPPPRLGLGGGRAPCLAHALSRQCLRTPPCASPASAAWRNMKLVCSMPLTTFTSVNTGKPPAASAAAALVDDPNPPPLSPLSSSSSKSAASSLGRKNPSSLATSRRPSAANASSASRAHARTPASPKRAGVWYATRREGRYLRRKSNTRDTRSDDPTRSDGSEAARPGGGSEAARPAVASAAAFTSSGASSGASSSSSSAPRTCTSVGANARARRASPGRWR